MTTQKGNVLFLILIAVALFAALSYAVTSSTRSGNSSVSKDKAHANAASILQYAATYKSAIMRMKVSNGCTDGIFEFSNSIYTRNDLTVVNTANTNAPTDKKCHLFDPAGGGMIPIIPVAEALCTTCSPNSTDFKSGIGAFRMYQMKGIGTDGAAGDANANDLILQIHALTKQTCIALNDLVGVVNPGGDPPATGFTGGAGTYPNGSLASSGIASGTEIDGHPINCTGAGASYILRYVMIER